MAYIDNELRNMRLIWSAVSDKVMIIGLIVFAIVAARIVLAISGYAPAAM